MTNPDVSAVRDADRIVGLLEAEGKGPGRLIINRFKPELVRRGDMLGTADVLEILAIDLIGLVPEDEAVLVSSNRGTPAALIEKSRAGKTFHDVARRLLGDDVPFASTDDHDGLIDRFARRVRRGERP